MFLIENISQLNGYGHSFCCGLSALARSCKKYKYTFVYRNRILRVLTVHLKFIERKGQTTCFQRSFKIELFLIIPSLLSTYPPQPWVLDKREYFSQLFQLQIILYTCRGEYTLFLKISGQLCILLFTISEKINNHFHA